MVQEASLPQKFMRDQATASGTQQDRTATDPVAKMNVAEDPVRFRMNSLDRHGWTRSRKSILGNSSPIESQGSHPTVAQRIPSWTTITKKREMGGCGGARGEDAIEDEFIMTLRGSFLTSVHGATCFETGRKRFQRAEGGEQRE